VRSKPHLCMLCLRCNVLQCVAVCCSVLQCAAVCCSVLQCAAVCCSDTSMGQVTVRSKPHLCMLCLWCRFSFGCRVFVPVCVRESERMGLRVCMYTVGRERNKSSMGETEREGERAISFL